MLLLNDVTTFFFVDFYRLILKIDIHRWLISITINNYRLSVYRLTTSGKVDLIPRLLSPNSQKKRKMYHIGIRQIFSMPTEMNRGWKLNNWITIIHYSLLFSPNYSLFISKFSVIFIIHFLVFVSILLSEIFYNAIRIGYKQFTFQCTFNLIFSKRYSIFELFWKNSSYVSGVSVCIFVALYVGMFVARANKVEGTISWCLGTNEILAST